MLNEENSFVSIWNGFKKKMKKWYRKLKDWKYNSSRVNGIAIKCKVLKNVMLDTSFFFCVSLAHHTKGIMNFVFTLKAFGTLCGINDEIKR